MENYLNLDTHTHTHTHTFDLFGELDSVWVCERTWLLIDIVDVQDLTHELDHRLGLIERCGRHCRTEQRTTWGNRI